MLTAYFKDPVTLVRYRQGPAGPDLGEFVAWLVERGYRRGSVRRSVRATHHFALWAERTGLTLPQLDRTVLAAFGEHLKRHHRLKYSGGDYRHAFVGACHFVDFLAATDRLARPEPDVSAPPEPVLLAAFRRWMHAQRGTLDVTLNNYRLTLLDLLQTVGAQPDRYNAEALRGFVLDRASRHGLGKAKLVVTAVRMFLRYLVATGQCAAGLDQAIPTIAHWRLARLPKYLSAEAVERVIASCDLTIPSGQKTPTY